MRAQEAERAVGLKEQEIADFEAQLADSSLYTDAKKAAQVNIAYQKAQEDLLKLYEAWEAAEAALQAEED